MDSHSDQTPNHDRWLISYADFITLLFAVFVVLFATAHSNKDSARQVSEAVMVALKSGSLTLNSRGQSGKVTSGKQMNESESAKVVAQAAMAELLPSLEVLSEKFRDEIAKGKIDVRLDPRGMVISLRQAVFFQSGQAAIDPATYPIMDKVAAVIQSVPNAVHLEGHTDAVPISNSQFASNWQLSAARSIAMLDLLTTRNKIPCQRLSIAGYADTMPLESNEDPEGRSHNRRVDVLILNGIMAADQVPKPKAQHSPAASAH